MGEHVYVTAKNAREVIDTAILALIEDVQHSSRANAFEECTTYWSKEIKKIVDDGGPSAAQLGRIKELFRLPRE